MRRCVSRDHTSIGVIEENARRARARAAWCTTSWVEDRVKEDRLQAGHADEHTGDIVGAATGEAFADDGFQNGVNGVPRIQILG